jgi:hypothetical protein
MVIIVARVDTKHPQYILEVLLVRKPHDGLATDLDGGKC